MKKNINCVFNFISLFFISLILSACSYKNYRHNKYHVVKPGETLYSIAKKHNVKLDNLVKANFIKFPYTINRGQRLILSNSRRLNLKPQYSNIKTTKPRYAAKNVATNKPQAMPTAKTTYSYNNQEPVKYNNIINKDWGWPAHGSIVKQFIATGPNKGNGIDIVGKKGDPVLSTANGKVVYSGNNLRGYGNLVIIKHNQDFLSAYAHNEKILVKEQQEVKRGQQIATMGDSEAKRVLLHFEVRYKGKPIDPLRILAKKGG